jgi:hypothetical protein
VQQPGLALLLAAAIGLGGCAAVGPGTFGTWQVDQAEAGSTLTLGGVPVRTGQIVVSEQGSPQSMLLSLLVADQRPYTHSGIVVVEDGVPWVYDANATVRPTFDGGPINRNLAGSVRRQKLERFLGKQRFIALYDPPAGTDAEGVARFARQSHAAGTPFDAYFDQSDPAKVYCSEFVALALAAGGVPATATSPMNPNASVALILDWLEITTPAVIQPWSIVGNLDRVGLFSREHTPAQVEAYFAVKAELHRRFTPEQKLGNVLYLTSIGSLKYQPAVMGLILSVNEAAAGWSGLPPAEIDRQVRWIAGQQLGTFEPGDVPLARRTGSLPGVVSAGAASAGALAP